MERPILHVWITKYALTTGIFERVVTHNIDIAKGFITAHGKDQPNGIEMGYDENYHTEGSEWHRTEQGAKDFANLMVAKKIKSLKAQIKRLEQLKF